MKFLIFLVKQVPYNFWIPAAMVLFATFLHFGDSTAVRYFMVSAVGFLVLFGSCVVIIELSQWVAKQYDIYKKDRDE